MKKRFFAAQREKKATDENEILWNYKTAKKVFFVSVDKLGLNYFFSQGVFVRILKAASAFELVMVLAYIDILLKLERVVSGKMIFNGNFSHSLT